MGNIKRILEEELIHATFQATKTLGCIQHKEKHIKRIVGKLEAFISDELKEERERIKEQERERASMNLRTVNANINTRVTSIGLRTGMVIDGWFEKAEDAIRSGKDYKYELPIKPVQGKGEV